MLLQEKIGAPPRRKAKKWWGAAGGEASSAQTYLGWTITGIPARIGRDAETQECPSGGGGFGNSITFVRATAPTEFGGGTLGLCSLASWVRESPDWVLAAKREADNPATPEDDTELIHAVGSESVDIPPCTWVRLEVSGTIEPGYRIDDASQSPPVAYFADTYDWAWNMYDFDASVMQALGHEAQDDGSTPFRIRWVEARQCEQASG